MEKKLEGPEEKLRNIVQTHRKSLSMGRAIVGSPTPGNIPANIPAVPAVSDTAEKPAAVLVTEAQADPGEQLATELGQATPAAESERDTVAPDATEPTPLVEEAPAIVPAAPAVDLASAKMPAAEEEEAISSASPAATPSVQEREIPILHEPAVAPAAAEPSSEPAKGTLSPRPATERRSSAVLERVRAMEAQAQASEEPEKKLPGSFD